MSSVLTPSPTVSARPLPECEQLYEVVDGVHAEKPVCAGSVWIANELQMMMAPHARAEQLGTVVMEMMFIPDFERDLRRRPDVAFVSAAQRPVGQMPPLEGDWEIIPEMAIEVVSPSNRYSELIRKLHEYFDYGVQEVWLISPEEQLSQIDTSPDDMRTVRDDAALSTELIPGWSVAMSTLVPKVDPQPAAGE